MSSEASILQLVSKSSQDDFFLKDPTVSFFKHVYKKYINFSTETFSISPSSNVDFGKKVIFEIPKRGDLLSDIYLHIKVPKLVATSGTFLSWSDVLGYCIFTENGINLEIDGNVVERLYPRFMDISNDLNVGPQKNGLNLMLNKSDIYFSNTTNALKDYDLIIPLEFFFTKKYNVALPVSSFDYNKMQIVFDLRKFKELINFDGDEPEQDSHIIDCNLICECIYLDNDIVDVFRQQKHEFVINQTQMFVKSFSANSLLNVIDLPFQNPVKEINLVATTQNYINNNNYFIYQNTSSEPFINKISFLFNHKPKFDNLPEFIYRSIFTKKTHTNIPLKYIYCIPFSLTPENNQPSGYLNFSNIYNPILQLEMNPTSEEIIIYVYASSMNILSIQNNSFLLSFFC